MAHSPIERAGMVSAPEHRPEENDKRPWAVDYVNGVRFDGTRSGAGTLYFKEATAAVCWRHAVTNGHPQEIPF
ncbi:hypothetical protein [Leisingera sp. F5]|uniref:hypothetical protein n=1 Tax=Leisingera sp. F5 TaxID=1813816 RepID=UPI000AF5F0C7|nr:hypothetical protein [Leisingera sp. F5]